MSDDLVNQLTLNFLISKKQLQKLNKQYKADNKNKELSNYKERLVQLFEDLLVHNPPDDLMCNVTSSFEMFVEKAIYYFKIHDDNIKLENERNGEINDDIDYEQEERQIERGNYKEVAVNYQEAEEEEEEEELDETEENY